MKENINEVIKKLCGGSLEATQIVNAMAKNGKNLYLLIKLYEKNITGNDIVTLYNICCKGHSQIFKITMKLFEDGVFSDEEIIKNLSSPTPISFIADRFTGDLLMALDNKEYFNNVWDKFKLCNRESFIEKTKVAHIEEKHGQAI